MRFFQNPGPVLQLILASSSPIRQQLLSRLGLPFIVNAPDIDESPQGADEEIATYVGRLSVEKATVIARQHTDALVIAADQACTAGDGILGKPGNFVRALAQLRAHRGKWLHFHTSLTLMQAGSMQSKSVTETFSVQFHELSDADLEHYLALDEPWNCAGSFRLESRGIALFNDMQGRDYTSLLGLPLLSLCRLLREAGFDPLDPAPFT